MASWTAATAARGGAAAGCAVTAVGPLKTGEGQPPAPPTAAAGVRQVGGIGEVEISLPVEAAAADAAMG